jgi:hypothetical protein
MSEDNHIPFKSIKLFRRLGLRPQSLRAHIFALEGSSGYYADSGFLIALSDSSEKCLRSLEQNPEYLSDEYLIQLVKLQTFTEEINQALPRHKQDFSISSAAPVQMCIRTLQSKLDSFRMKLPLNLQQNRKMPLFLSAGTKILLIWTLAFILMHYHCVLAYLTETALTFPLSTRQATLHACLTSTHAFCSFLFSIPLVDWYKITYVSWSQMRHVLIVLYKLSNFESPDWDLSHVRRILDLSVVLENIVSQLEKVQIMASRSGDGQGDGLLFRFIPALRQYKEAFEQKRAIVLGENRTPSAGPTPPIPLENLMFGQLDDAFWQEIVNDWNLLPPIN